MKKKEKIAILVSFIALVLIVIGISYAYFSAQITGNESSTTLTVEGGTLSIVYSGGSNITVSNTYPQSAAQVTKTFTVTGTNTTDTSMPYTLSLVVTSNTLSDNALTYTLDSTNTSSNGNTVSSISSTGLATGTGTYTLGSGNFTKGTSSVHTYVLKIYFLSTGSDQNSDQGKTFSAYIKTEAGEAKPISVVSMFPTFANKTCNQNGLSGACLSEAVLFPFNYGLANYYVLANGAMLSITTGTAALFNLIGSNFGGNGVTTFQLPTLASPLTGVYYYMATSGTTPTSTLTPTVTSGNYDYFTYNYTTNTHYYTGQIVLAKNVTNNNGIMLPCDGRTLSVTSYSTLYAIIGAAFGGNGVTTFALPNMSALTSPVDGYSYYMIINGQYPTKS